jgi:hypothetical protein
MSTSTKVLRSTPERERAIALALHVAAKEIAGSVVSCMNTCVNCIHFDEPSEVCALAGQRPPARVIAYGCNSYEHFPF